MRTISYYTLQNHARGAVCKLLFFWVQGKDLVTPSSISYLRFISETDVRTYPNNVIIRLGKVVYWSLALTFQLGIVPEKLCRVYSTVVHLVSSSASSKVYNPSGLKSRTYLNDE